MKSTFVLVLSALLVGCTQRPAPSNSDPAPPPAVPESQEVHRSSIKVGDFTISTTLDVPMTTSVQDASAVLTFGGHKLIADFDKHQLSIDDNATISLPPDVNEIQVKFVRGTLLVSVDEVPVFPPGE
jgi:hypothetical protein